METERRFYLANSVDVAARNADGEIYFEVRMSDAWVWDMYRPARFVKNVRVLTFKDVNVEELDKPDLRLPEGDQFGYLSTTATASTRRSGRSGPVVHIGRRLSTVRARAAWSGRPPTGRSWWRHGSEGRARAPR